jgi:hypothetical protein
MLAWIFLFVVLAVVGKLVYDKQKSKKQTPTQMYGFDKDEFQKLAGIKPINENDELRQILVKNNFPKEQIVDALLKAAVNGEFPKQDESINMGTTKIGTIDTNFADNDPLASVPMSRVSKEAKQKMAEIAKQDITSKLEENAANLPQSIKTNLENELNKMNAIVTGQTPPQNKCGCGRSETGFCTGLHMIPKKDWAAGVREIPAPKKKANPKQSVKEGYTESEPFVKTKRKYTKKPKA